MPKFNMYQSLHTTVIGPPASRSELQIRTNAMHREPSTASPRTGDTRRTPTRHRGRSQSSPPRPDSRGPSDMAWLRQLLDWQKETEDPGEFLESLRFELHHERGLRLHAQAATSSRCLPAPRRSTSPTRCTPRSATAASARGSTAGWCRWSRRSTTATSSRSSPRRRSGAGPSRGLADVRRSARARNKIKQWFSKERRDEAIETGKDEHRQGDAQAGPAVAADALPARRSTVVATELRYPDITALYAAVGEGHCPRRAWCRSWSRPSAARSGTSDDAAEAATATRPRRRTAGDPGVVVKGEQRRVDQAGPLLHAGAGRRDRRLRDPRITVSRCTGRTA